MRCHRYVTLYIFLGYILTTIIFILAHKNAWEDARILHRDISIGNIMFSFKRAPEDRYVTEGVLNDWDLCIYEGEMNLAGSPTGRTVCL